MKFAVETVTKFSGRCGRIADIDRLPGKSFTTPMVMVNTNYASIPHLTRDLVDSLNLETAGITIDLTSTYRMEAGVKALGKGIAKFSALGDFLSFITLKNSYLPSMSGFHERGSVPVFTKVGKFQMSAKQYMDLVEAYRPDFYHAMCDGDTVSDSPTKRVIKAVERSNGFLAECLERRRSSSVLQNTPIVGVVEGGYSIPAREKSIANLVKHDEIWGFFIDGLHTNGESASKLESNDLQKLITRCIELLPDEKPRLMQGAYQPHMVLELIALGVDIFDTSFPTIAALENRALIFDFSGSARKTEDELLLSDKKYADDFRPFKEGCTCLACRNHTRAYTQHLIATKEMLAPILLMIHNIHHYVEFFKAIRKRVSDDTLPELKEAMANFVTFSGQNISGEDKDSDLKKHHSKKIVKDNEGATLQKRLLTDTP